MARRPVRGAWAPVAPGPHAVSSDTPLPALRKLQPVSPGPGRFPQLHGAETPSAPSCKREAPVSVT